MSHTPKVTRQGSTIIFPATEDLAGAMFGTQGGNKEVNRIYARRIVACVNACEGFTTEALEAQVQDGHGVIRAFQMQRDELLIACRRSVLALAAAAELRPEFHGDYKALSAAIAKSGAANA